MRYLLDLLYLILLVATTPYWIYQAVRAGKYRAGLWDRFRGAAAAGPRGRCVVWLHAVSVGETALLGPLISRLGQEYPDTELVVSTGTDTAFALARMRYSHLAVFRAPFDFHWAVERVLDRLAPRLIVLAEAELWPNLLFAARRRGIPIAVVNARISPRSLARYRRIQWLLRPALEAIRFWGAQSPEGAERIRTLVGPNPSIQVTGSLKMDGALTDREHPRIRELRDVFGLRPGDIVLVAGSTQSPEEEIVLAAWMRLRERYPSIVLLLVPRHPERFDEVQSLLIRSGVAFARRSGLPSPGERERVILVDTVGELAYVWGLADMGFVGGSLENDRGGQSMIEPAALGVPACFGPNTWNFAEVARGLVDAGGAVQFEHRDQVADIWAEWLSDPGKARAIGTRGRAFIERSQGALERTLDGLRPYLPLAAKSRFTFRAEGNERKGDARAVGTGGARG